MLKSSLYDYSDAYILVKQTIPVANMKTAATANADSIDEKVLLKNCALFIDSISISNNTRVDDTKEIDVVAKIYNLI